VKTFRIQKIIGALALCMLMVACSSGPLFTASHGGLGGMVSARDQEFAAGQYTGTLTVVPTNAEGQVLQSRWEETYPEGGGTLVEDLPSTCAAHISNNETNFNFLNGGMSHVVATGNAAPETCIAIGTNIAQRN